MAAFLVYYKPKNRSSIDLIQWFNFYHN